MPKLIPGLTGEATVAVTEANSAATLKSGSLPVFATPAMCALMEEAACAAVNSCLEEGMSTVGIRLEITHDRATALGGMARAKAELTEIAGRKLTFRVSATDAKGVIGAGKHERFIINCAKFMAKAQS